MLDIGEIFAGIGERRFLWAFADLNQRYLLFISDNGNISALSVSLASLLKKSKIKTLGIPPKAEM